MRFGEWMRERTHWLDLFTAKTWTEFLAAGATVSGFREHRWGVVKQMRPGDYLLCYMTGISRFIGLLEVASEPYQDEAPVWADEIFPSRVRVKKLVELTLETAVPVILLRDQLSFMKDVPEGQQWTGPFRGSPRRFDVADGDLIVSAIKEAELHPSPRPYKLADLNRPMVRTDKGGASADQASTEGDTEDADERLAAPGPIEFTPNTGDEAATDGGPERDRAHVEMQWTLGKLGNDLGLDVWIPTGDRGFTFEGQALGDLRLGRLPLMFDEKITRRIRNIDVLWIKGSAIVAAFEVENSTSVYSGILRMADLIALAPGFRIPLYVVAPDERRRKVMGEVTRPTFERLDPPMSAACRFIPYSTVRMRLPEQAMRAFTSPNFLQGVSEACIGEDD
jgi:hypothetical protein